MNTTWHCLGTRASKYKGQRPGGQLTHCLGGARVDRRGRFLLKAPSSVVAGVKRRRNFLGTGAHVGVLHPDVHCVVGIPGASASGMVKLPVPRHPTSGRGGRGRRGSVHDFSALNAELSMDRAGACVQIRLCLKASGVPSARRKMPSLKSGPLKINQKTTKHGTSRIEIFFLSLRLFLETKTKKSKMDLSSPVAPTPTVHAACI